jgi:hypothetical protein
VCVSVCVCVCVRACVCVCLKGGCVQVCVCLCVMMIIIISILMNLLETLSEWIIIFFRVGLITQQPLWNVKSYECSIMKPRCVSFVLQL